MKREGIRSMPTKSLERQETLPAKNLRSISQKGLLDIVNRLEKVGVILNDNVSLAMMSWENYERMVDMIEDYAKRVEELEDYIEDMEMASIYSQRAEEIEQKEVEGYKFRNARELFDQLND